MAPHKALSLLFLTLSLLAATAAVSPPSLLNAAESLANSDHISMSLSLQLIAQTLPKTLTIFAPPDSAFISAGQPPLSHLLLHLSPVSISPASLRSISTLPSLSQSKHLTVTSSSPPISINNVAVSNSPIFDDGFVVVYAIDTFFDFNYKPSAPPDHPDGNFECSNSEVESRLGEVSGVLKSRGYSIMASFLDLQLMGYVGNGNDMVKWTLFAPVDEELVRFSGDFAEYSSIFMRHMVPCKVRWNDMEEMGNGSVIWKNMHGFDMMIASKDDGMVMVNGAEVTVPEMYDGESIVVHGIRGMISLPDEEEEIDSFESPVD